MRWSQIASRPELARMQNPKARLLQLFMAGVAISMAFVFFGTPTKHPRANDE